MARPVKVFRNGDVLFVTTSIEQGVLLPPNPLLNLILLSCLAHAQTLHWVRIAAFLVEGTHIHLILVVVNPKAVCDFMERFKTESAHLINRLLGRKKRTVWCESFDAPVLPTPEDVERKLRYLYCNPVKDGLVPTVSEYPGLSSWDALRAGQTQVLKAPRLFRPRVKSLPKGKRLKNKDYQKIAEELAANAPFSETLTVEPFAWMEAFGLSQEEQQATHQDIIQSLYRDELSYQKERALLKKGFLGKERLADSGFDLSYVSPRSGKRTLCITSNGELRKRFLIWVRSLRKEARKVLCLWRQGDFSVPYPPGLFPPGLPMQSNLVPALVRF